jgi:hypothetical protein
MELNAPERRLAEDAQIVIPIERLELWDQLCEALKVFRADLDNNLIQLGPHFKLLSVFAVVVNVV